MSSRFDCVDLPLPGLRLVQRKPIGDSRGSFERLFCSDELSRVFPDTIKQVNHSVTARRGAVRGLHFQHPPHAETKYVSCLRGAIFDVAVDVREGSRTFLRWHAEILSSENHKTLVVPRGYAHGFQALTDDCVVLYLTSAPYSPASESALNARDPRLRIEWPESITDISARDASHPMLTDDFTGVRL